MFSIAIKFNLISDILVLMKAFLLLFIIQVILIASMQSRTQVAMGTFISVKLEEEHIKYSSRIFEIFKEIEDSISSYKKDSVIFMLNKNKSAKLDRFAFESLNISKELYEDTDGYFDITVGSITKDLYHFGESEFIPHVKVLKSAKVGFERLKFDENRATLDSHVKVDLGGMGKGYAVDKAIEYLKKEGITKSVVAASGDIRCLKSCKIDIQNPQVNSSHVNSVLLSFETLGSEIGVSTSGNYNRYVKSSKNNHLINPKSKKSQEEFISITLISDISSTKLDAYTTAVSVMPKNQAYKFLKNRDIAYVILQADKKLVVSDNISKYVKKLLTDI